MGTKVTVTTQPGNRVSINNQQRATIRTVGLKMPSATDTNLKDLADVDATDADSNETLVYDEATRKFIVKPLPIVNGGEF